MKESDLLGDAGSDVMPDAQAVDARVGRVGQDGHTTLTAQPVRT